MLAVGYIAAKSAALFGAAYLTATAATQWLTTAGVILGCLVALIGIGGVLVRAAALSYRGTRRVETSLDWVREQMEGDSDDDETLVGKIERLDRTMTDIERRLAAIESA